jgi:hypothetical protein
MELPIEEPKGPVAVEMLQPTSKPGREPGGSGMLTM